MEAKQSLEKCCMNPALSLWMSGTRNGSLLREARREKL
jgi:hypothetical protein